MLTTTLALTVATTEGALSSSPAPNPSLYSLYALRGWVDVLRASTQVRAEDRAAVSFLEVALWHPGGGAAFWGALLPEAVRKTLPTAALGTFSARPQGWLVLTRSLTRSLESVGRSSDVQPVMQWSRLWVVVWLSFSGGDPISGPCLREPCLRS